MNLIDKAKDIRLDLIDSETHGFEFNGMIDPIKVGTDHSRNFKFMNHLERK